MTFRTSPDLPPDVQEAVTYPKKTDAINNFSRNGVPSTALPHSGKFRI
jgi:hypothetical protein